MFRAVSSWVRSFGLTGFTVSVFAFVLLLTMDGLIPHPLEASALGRQVATARRSQARAATRMRRADHKLKAIRRQRETDAKERKSGGSRVNRLKQRRASARSRLRRADARLEIAELDLGRKLRVHPNPLRFQAADKPKARKQVKSLRAKARLAGTKASRIERKTARAQKKQHARHRRRGRYRRRINAKIRQRESAEALLGTRIREMIDLAQQKVVRKTRVTPASGGLKRPTRGHISQRFGCTRVRKVKGSRRCVQYHDGIDIAAPRGTRVHASANGVVVYSGFNPWDNRRRAFTVIIAHRGGLLTTYAHLRPGKRVKAGQYVRQGQTIGYVGVTGHTSGPHVHWEVSRDGHMKNPLALR
jgi:murein DD-endopeptidase MepM/ murein hydrolase activator NlpD